MRRHEMNRRIIAISFSIAIALLMSGCSTGGPSPSAPPTVADLTTQTSPVTGNNTHLWGYWVVSVDVENMTVEAIPDRHGTFTANVVNFLNDNPLNLSFAVNQIVPGPGYLDVDIDVTIRHPFPGMPQFNGYDVRGVFMGDGSAALETNADLIYPVEGTDQFMLPNPVSGDGGPDGYTRWFNASEFEDFTLPLVSYTPGTYATPGYEGSATLCPYKYYANDLGSKDDLWTFLNDNPGGNGLFESGAIDTRNFYLRFPDTAGVTFGYAVLANWSAPDIHPSNAPETIGCDVLYTGDVYWVDDSINGGNIILDISLWDWGVVSAGVGDYTILLESTTLASPYEYTPAEMIPVGGTDHYSTYHAEIPVDYVTSPDDQEYWVIVRYDNYDYTNEFGVMNTAWEEPMNAYFRYDLPVSYEIGNQDPVCDLEVVTSMPQQNWGVVQVEFDATGSYEPDGDPLTFEWDFDNDGDFGDSYDSGTDDNPVKNFTFTNTDQVCLKLTDGLDGEMICCVDVDITVASTKNIPLRTDEVAKDLALTPEGDLLILYDDGEVWKYYLSSQYQQADADFMFTAQVVPWVSQGQLCNQWIDVDPNGDMIVSAATGTGFGSDSWPAQNYDANGNQLGSAPAPGTGGPITDVVACKSGGSWPYSHFILAPYNSATNYQNNMYRKYPNFTGNSWTQNYGPGPFSSPQIGHDGIWLGYVKGTEAIDGQRFWILKDPEDGAIQDYYAVKCNQSSYFYYYWDNEWFGTGDQTDDDDGWYEACDLSMDSEGRFYVLDRLSTGQGRIKLFEAGAPGEALTDHAAGDPDSIGEDPLRIEGSDYVDSTYGNMMFVLHGDDVPCKLSVFFMSEFGF